MPQCARGRPCCSRSADVAATATAVPQTADARAPSVAHLWNETLLGAIRRDFARPTVHARNLFHVSAAMYDAWALYSDTASTYLAGKTVHGYTCALTGVSQRGDLQELREEAISYAAYRMIRHRFAASPGADAMTEATDELMATLGFDPSYHVDERRGRNCCGRR